MKRRALLVLGLCMMMLTLLTGVVLALSETEPNDNTDEADELPEGEQMDGAIGETGDQDYYAVQGMGPTWGFIALLDTSQSTESTEATLTVLNNSGTEVNSDTGSWEKGSGIALQNYMDGSLTHYLRVNELENNGTVTTYTLRYYNTIIETQPEVEPNGSRGAGTPSSLTHAGTISSEADKDCYAFHGRVDDIILVALDSNPTADGPPPTNARLELISPSDEVLHSVDETNVVDGDSEFLEYGPLEEEGVYAYCVSASFFIFSAPYRVGIVRNGDLYAPDYEYSTRWLNPRPDGAAYLHDTLTFQLAFTNTSPITIPGTITMTASYSTTLLNYLSASPDAATTEPGRLAWAVPELAPGEAFTAIASFEPLSYGSDKLGHDILLNYYYDNIDSGAPYAIHRAYFFPFVSRSE